MVPLSPFSLVGVVLLIGLAVMALSGLGMYVAFRIRETLNDARGRGAKAAKLAFLIGLLFLSGTTFYLFATGIGTAKGPGSTSEVLLTSTGPLQTHQFDSSTVTTANATVTSTTTAYETSHTASSTSSSTTVYATTTTTSASGGICLPILGCL